MGTRNLTVVIHKNKIKLSQYGQWDGYFSCTGVKFLEFVKDNLQGEDNQRRKEEFIDNLKHIKDIDEQNFDRLIAIAKQLSGSIDNKTKYAIPFNLLFPALSRDTGVEILNIIKDLPTYELGSKKFPINICLDSGWCEFINVINLDKNEIYMLTSHEFKGKKLSTCSLVEETYDMPCWYKSKIAEIPSIEDIKKHKEAIGLDYWQREETGEWISN